MPVICEPSLRNYSQGMINGMPINCNQLSRGTLSVLIQPLFQYQNIAHFFPSLDALEHLQIPAHNTRFLTIAFNPAFSYKSHHHCNYIF